MRSSGSISVLGAISSAAFGGSVAYIGSYYYFSVQANKILSGMNNNNNNNNSTKRISKPSSTTTTDNNTTTTSIVSRSSSASSPIKVYNINMDLDSLAKKAKTIFAMFAEVTADTFKHLVGGRLSKH